jgi:hypothetical protein
MINENHIYKCRLFCTLFIFFFTCLPFHGQESRGIWIESEATLYSAFLLNKVPIATSSEKSYEKRNRRLLGVGETVKLKLITAKLTAAEKQQLIDTPSLIKWSVEINGVEDENIACILLPKTGSVATLKVKIPQQQGPLTDATPSITCPPANKKVDGTQITVVAKIPSFNLSAGNGNAPICYTIKTPQSRKMIGKKTGIVVSPAPPIGSLGASAGIYLIPEPLGVNFSNGIWVREIARENGADLPLNVNSIFHGAPHSIKPTFFPINAQGAHIDKITVSITTPTYLTMPSDYQYCYWECGFTWAKLINESDSSIAIELARNDADNSSYVSKLGEMADIKQEFEGAKEKQATIDGISVTLKGVVLIKKAGSAVLRSVVPSFQIFTDMFPTTLPASN